MAVRDPKAAQQDLDDTRRQAMTKLLGDPERLREIRARARAKARQTVLERRAVTEAELGAIPDPTPFNAEEVKQ